MSFSLSKPRKHPRRHSVSWRALGWVIEREAAFMVLNARASQVRPPFTRRGLGAAPRYVVRGLVARMLQSRPERGIL